MSDGKGIVRLNVGGTLYTTTRATLTHYPHSMLGAMFNGSIPTTVIDSDSSCFIDRNGRLFQYILDFLRSSQLSLPSDFKDLDGLAVEADFYQIQPLIECIQRLRAAAATSHETTKGNFIEVIEVRTGPNATMPTINSRSKTIASSRRDVIANLPEQFFGVGQRPQLRPNSVEQDYLQDYLEVELCGSNVRLRLAEYLHNSGWQLTNSDMSSSSSCYAKATAMNVCPISIEHTYRDRWFRPAGLNSFHNHCSKSIISTLVDEDVVD